MFKQRKQQKNHSFYTKALKKRKAFCSAWPKKSQQILLKGQNPLKILQNLAKPGHIITKFTHTIAKLSQNLAKSALTTEKLTQNLAKLALTTEKLTQNLAKLAHIKQEKLSRWVTILPFIYSGFAFAALQPPAQKDGEGPSVLEQFFPFIIIGLLFYFLLIRPQQRKHKQHGDFLSKIKRGDEVLTSSGIYGKIEGLTEEFVILEIADNTRIRILKSQISSWADLSEKNNSKIDKAHKKE